MKNIEWPEISDASHPIDVMVAFVSGQDMQALGEIISLDAAKVLYSNFCEGALESNTPAETLAWLSGQMGKPLTKLVLPAGGGLMTLYGFFCNGGAAALSDYSRHGHFCETVFGDLHQVSLDWVEAGTGEPFSLIFCW